METFFCELFPGELSPFSDTTRKLTIAYLLFSLFRSERSEGLRYTPSMGFSCARPPPDLSDLEPQIIVLDCFLAGLVGPLGFSVISLSPRDVLLHLLGKSRAAICERWEHIDPTELGETLAVPIVDGVVLLLVTLELGSDVLVEEHADLGLNRPAPHPLEVGVPDVAKKQYPLGTRVRFGHAPRQFAALEGVEPPRLLGRGCLDDLLDERVGLRDDAEVHL